MCAPTGSVPRTPPASSGSARRKRPNARSRPRKCASSKEFRKRLLEEVYKRVPSELPRHELDFIAQRYFNHLGHDSQHRIFKFLAWEATKAKGSYGGYADFPKLAATKLEAMTTAEIGRFLLVCALASDLYCPTYLSGATLTKDSKLAQEAAHYKINAGRLLCEVKERLAKKSRNENSKSKLQTPGKPKRNGNDS